MAAEEAWTCSICRDVRRDIAYAIPCNHVFCLGCIHRWARLRDSCPLCRMAMKTTRVSVRGENQYVECIVSPPAVPVPAGFGPATGPSGTAASAPPSAPPSPEPVAAEPERVGGLLPDDWAALFRVRRDILDPVLPWLQQELCRNQELGWWKINWLKSMILAFLCQVGPDRDLLVQCAEHALGPTTAPLIDALIRTIESRCSQEARRLLGLEDPSASLEQEDGPEDPSAAQELEGGLAAQSAPATSPPGTVASGSSTGPDVEELPSTSSGALGRGAGEPGPEAAGPSEQGRSRGPSARSRGRKRSAGGPRRPTKRRAGSAQRAPPPCKRRPPQRL
ncbi:uncharacterized protein LOC110389963 [Numida meleagris]|uniref:uncharacterized protein LOC110389963 n=1 Tax=Numida meleagris TaxID=8996 RepID=UPI000B3D80A3|nr:uncharacterized protein LOC110389963 [Numida meleagris]